MKNFILISTTLLLLFGCNNKTKIAEDAFIVDPTTKNILKMSDFIESVSYINLEVTDDGRSIVDMVKSVYVDEENLFVVGKGIISLFDINGRFKHRIGRIGRGEGEYLSADATTIDTLNNRFIVCDTQSKKILYYSYDGKFIKDIKINISPEIIRDMEYIYSTGGFLCTEYMHIPKSSGMTELWDTDSLGNKVNDLFVSDFIHPTASPTVILHRNSNDEIIYSALDDLSDYIYSDGKLAKITSYDVKGVVASDLKGMSNMEFSQEYWLKNKNANFRTYTIIQGDYEFTSWMGEVLGEAYYTLVNKRENKIYVGKELDRKLENGQIVIPSKMKINNKIFAYKSNMKGVIVVPIYINSIDDPEILKQLNMTQEQAEDANTIIQILHVK